MQEEEFVKVARMDDYAWGHERPREEICPICKKKVLIYNHKTWAYKIQRFPKYNGKAKRVITYYCSWHCLREGQKHPKTKTVTCKQCGKKMRVKYSAGRPKQFCRECHAERKRERYQRCRNAAKEKRKKMIGADEM